MVSATITPIPSQAQPSSTFVSASRAFMRRMFVSTKARLIPRALASRHNLPRSSETPGTCRVSGSITTTVMTPTPLSLRSATAGAISEPTTSMSYSRPSPKSLANIRSRWGTIFAHTARTATPLRMPRVVMISPPPLHVVRSTTQPPPPLARNSPRSCSACRLGGSSTGTPRGRTRLYITEFSFRTIGN